MGFNTVYFGLNDLAHTLENSPKTLAGMLSHPQRNNAEWHNCGAIRAQNHNEPELHNQAIGVVDTFHADNTLVVAFGQNYHTVLHHTFGGHHTEESKLRFLKEMAKDLGYSLRKSPKK